MNKNLLKIIILAKEHRLIIVGAILLTLMIFAPLLAFPYVTESRYQGININHFGNDSHFYLMRGKEVLEGHGLGNPMLKEGKNNQDIYHSYSDYLLLAPIKLLGLSDKVNIVTLYNIYNFVGIFILILLIYVLVWQLSKDKLLSSASALFVIGGYSIIYSKTLFYSDFNVYARLIYPYFSSLLFFIYLNYLVKSLKSDKLKYKILAGIFFGLLFYIYFYAWSFALALNGCLFLVYILRKDFLSVKKIIFVSLIGLTIGLYNLISLFLSLKTEMGKQMSYFVWMSFGNQPIFSKIGFIALILFFFYWYRARNDKNLWFFFAIILSGWVALNQQIITGRMLQYGHYYWYSIVPLSIIICFYIIYNLINNEKIKKYLFIAVILIVFINTAGGQYKSFFTTFSDKIHEQDFRPLVDYLNKVDRPGVILAADGSDEYPFILFTSYDLFWHTTASLSQVPIERFEEALFVYFYLNIESRNNFKEYLEKISDNKAEFSLYRDLYRNLEGYWSGYDYYQYNNMIKNGDERLSSNRADTIERLSQKYDKINSMASGITGLLKKYEVSYIVWDKNKNPEWDLTFIKDLNQVVLSNNIILYSLDDKY